ncbi:MAG: hypothetical protein KME45_31470 [Stenomitos rutilans HA7619-LM2]|nr:hypothetical protein [Stenomitos rutilans HA7619-LM2]
MNVTAASGRCITSLRLTRFAARLRSTAPIRTAVLHAPQGAGNLPVAIETGDRVRNEDP